MATMPLFSDPRCRFRNGFIQIQTEFPFYEPGNTVNGTISLRVTHEITCAKDLELEVKGGRKSSFIRFYHETEGHGENARSVQKQEKLKKADNFMYFKQSVAKFYEKPALHGHI